jgi:hypothetical protein
MSTFVKKMSKFVRKNISFEIVEGNEKDTDKNTNDIIDKKEIERPKSIFNLEIYKITRNPYKNSEFIPINLLTVIMQHHFQSSIMIHKFNETHMIYKILIGDLLVASIKNWEYNRPPDMARCPDIARYIYNSKKPVDTMLYLTYTNINDNFEVLDGIHRLTALKIIKEENSKTSISEFGSNGDAEWLYNQYLIVNIRFNANLGDLIDIFKNLNKSQTVPELYIKDHTKEKREIIDIIANEWYIKYKKHFSSSANPIMGNTNRNKFVELLDTIYDKYNIDETCTNKLRDVLDDINNKISGQIPSKASLDIRLKCKESGCYLFLYKNDKLLELINY